MGGTEHAPNAGNNAQLGNSLFYLVNGSSVRVGGYNGYGE